MVESSSLNSISRSPFIIRIDRWLTLGGPPTGFPWSSSWRGSSHSAKGVRIGNTCHSIRASWGRSLNIRMPTWRHCSAPSGHSRGRGRVPRGSGGLPVPGPPPAPGSRAGPGSIIAAPGRPPPGAPPPGAPPPPPAAPRRPLVATAACPPAPRPDPALGSPRGPAHDVRLAATVVGLLLGGLAVPRARWACCSASAAASSASLSAACAAASGRPGRGDARIALSRRLRPQRLDRLGLLEIEHLLAVLLGERRPLRRRTRRRGSAAPRPRRARRGRPRSAAGRSSVSVRPPEAMLDVPGSAPSSSRSSARCASSRALVAASGRACATRPRRRSRRRPSPSRGARSLAGLLARTVGGGQVRGEVVAGALDGQRATPAPAATAGRHHRRPPAPAGRPAEQHEAPDRAGSGRGMSRRASTAPGGPDRPAPEPPGSSRRDVRGAGSGQRVADGRRRRRRRSVPRATPGRGRGGRGRGRRRLGGAARGERAVGPDQRQPREPAGHGGPALREARDRRERGHPGANVPPAASPV